MEDVFWTVQPWEICNEIGMRWEWLRGKVRAGESVFTEKNLEWFIRSLVMQ